jgi:hypothetical protein
VGSDTDGTDRTDDVPMKYTTASQITDEAFFAGARKAAGHNNAAYLYVWELAWGLSDQERPAQGLHAAPDVSEFAVQQKAQRLALRGRIQAAPGKENLYLIPAAEELQ